MIYTIGWQRFYCVDLLWNKWDFISMTLIVGSSYQSLKKMDDMDSPTSVVQPNKCIVVACVASKCKATN
jgi:hypothetical protein